MQNDSSVIYTDVHEPYLNKRGVTEESLFWPVYIKWPQVLNRLVHVKHKVVTCATQLLLHKKSSGTVSR
jgi:hypothetical protein